MKNLIYLLFISIVLISCKKKKEDVCIYSPVNDYYNTDMRGQSSIVYQQGDSVVFSDTKVIHKDYQYKYTTTLKNIQKNKYSINVDSIFIDLYGRKINVKITLDSTKINECSYYYSDWNVINRANNDHIINFKLR